MAVKSITEDALSVMQQHDWRGNVRELKHVIESAVLQVDGSAISSADLKIDLADSADLRIGLPDGRVIRIDFDRGEPKLDEIEYAILQAAFEHTNHNLSQAARALGITREALRYRLNKFNETVQHTASLEMASIYDILGKTWTFLMRCRSPGSA